MARQFKPLTLDMIDEGRFLDTANTDLKELQRQHLEYIKEHGDLAEKSKSKLTIEITMQCDSPHDQMFLVKAQTKMSRPARPASATLAIGEETDEGDPSLFVRPSGSSATTPKQGVICTQDGKLVDPVTGEVKESKKR